MVPKLGFGLISLLFLLKDGPLTIMNLHFGHFHLFHQIFAGGFSFLTLSSFRPKLRANLFHLSIFGSIMSLLDHLLGFLKIEIRQTQHNRAIY